MTKGVGTLLLAWGNPGRGDDGLGPALAERLAERELEQVEIESGYQLQIEHAAAISGHRQVVFVDADRDGPEPFSCQRLRAGSRGLSFTSHSVRPSALLALTRELFGAEPEAWLIGIRGYDFDSFDEGLSRRALANLATAVDYLGAALGGEGLEELRPPSAAEGSDRPTDRESAT